MQFGKFHGWAFIALGALLVLVQVGLFFSGRQDASTAIETPAPHKVSALPGIVGGCSLIVGIGLFLAYRKQSQE